VNLRLTDYSTTVNLTATGAALRRYVPQAPEVDTTEAAQVGQDGADVFGVTYQNVQETAEVLLEGGLAAARATLNTINGLFQQARHRQRTGLGARVYVEYRLADTDAWYRSEVLFGRAVLDEGDLDYDTQLAVAEPQLVLFWTRRFYWEYAATSGGATAALEVPLDATSGGVAITNDAGNALAVDGDDVAGDLPAPLRLELTNTFATNRHYTIYTALNVFSAPATYSHHVAGATTAAVGTTETLLHTISLNAATLAALGGNAVRILALIASNWPNTLWLRWKVYWSVTLLWEGGWQQQTGLGLNDMGAVALPPRIVQGSGVNPEALELRLYGRDATNDGNTYTFTWFQLVPLDGWRVLVPAGYGLAQNTRVVDDGPAGEVWSDGWAGGGYAPQYLAHGQPLQVWPGRDQRLYVVVDSDTGTTVDGRTSTVRAYYRPRRLLL
jgi:hypothetical protein